MELDFMSEDWVKALEERLNASENFKKNGKGFKATMDLALVAEPEKNIEPCAVQLTLEGGTCKSAKRIAGPGPYEDDYVIRGVAENWKKLLTKEIFPAPALMSGQLKLVKGSTMSLMTQMGATQAILDEAAAVPTRFPG